jgi:hypothetical protein
MKALTLKLVLGVYLTATALVGCSSKVPEVMEAQTRAAVKRCLQTTGVADRCLATAKAFCVANNPVGVVMRESYVLEICTRVETEGWEALRTKAEVRLRDFSVDGGGVVPSEAQSTSRMWELYRDRWCEIEATAVPSASSGDYEMYRATCRSAVTKERVLALRRAVR